MRPALRLWLRRLAPWVVTAAVLAAILYKYPIDRIYAELEQGDPLAVAPFAVLLPLCHLVVQAIWDRWIINAGTQSHLSYFQVVRGRAGTAVLLALGFAFSSGGYGLWIARRTGADVRTTLSVVVYGMMSTLIAICLIAGAAVWIGGVHLEADAQRTIGVIAPAVAGALVILALIAPLLLVRRRNDARTLGAWARVGPGLFTVNLLGRCLDVALIVGYTWLAARAFGLSLPLAVAASYVPIILFVGSLPINVAGFGAVQGAWLMFTPWAPGERILAFQFVWHLMLSVVIVLRGAPFMRGVLREIAEGAKAVEGTERAGV
ncbi:MAG TPA: lysylphosphatidylglycerol synthase domain-containing protein [Kofleriaceae bacterium]|nr:lysylphosphatidylglycerol synthase domain-containing protein [Kofleriaceae bacterium]